MVEQQPSKLNTRVRFPSPAPSLFSQILQTLTSPIAGRFGSWVWRVIQLPYNEVRRPIVWPSISGPSRRHGDGGTEGWTAGKGGRAQSLQGKPAPPNALTKQSILSGRLGGRRLRCSGGRALSTTAQGGGGVRLRSNDRDGSDRDEPRWNRDLRTRPYRGAGDSQAQARPSRFPDRPGRRPGHDCALGLRLRLNPRVRPDAARATADADRAKCPAPGVADAAGPFRHCGTLSLTPKVPTRTGSPSYDPLVPKFARVDDPGRRSVN